MSPIGIHRNITLPRLIIDAYQLLRSLKPLTRRFGFPFSRSRDLVEIDITYRCNLSCNNCNRSCAQAPSRMDMPVDQIENFLQQSVSRGIKWKRIRLLGGEPTLHPAFQEILDLVLDYRFVHNPNTRIVLCTNGSGERVIRILSRLSKEVVVKSTRKRGRQRLTRPFNMAPQDSWFHRLADFRAGCRIIWDCGIGLTPMGYYPCAVAGGIDRIFGFKLGRPNLPGLQDDMRDQMNVFCRLCGHFGFLWPTRLQKTSSSWRAAYSRYSTHQEGQPQRPQRQ